MNIKIGDLKGSFLISSPIMIDDRFKKSVIFMCDIKKSSSFGLVVSNPIGTCANIKPLKKTPLAKADLYSGGPMEEAKLFLLHTNDVKWPTSLQINEQISVTNINDAIKNLEKLPEKYIVLAGYTNWQYSQLEHEVSLGFWLLFEDDMHLIFDNKKDKWQACTKALKLNTNTFTNYIGNA